MKMSKSNLDYVGRQFRAYTTIGYCKGCRQYDLLFEPNLFCLDCMMKKETDNQRVERTLKNSAAHPYRWVSTRMTHEEDCTIHLAIVLHGDRRYPVLLPGVAVE